MKNINNYLFEQFKISKDTKVSFANKYRGKSDNRRQSFSKFKKFFEDLSEMSGLIVNLIYYSKRAWQYIYSYKIRDNEPDKTANYSYSNNNNPDYYGIKTWKTVLKLMFDEEKLDLNSLDDLYEKNEKDYILFLSNLDEDEINELVKCGFKKYIDKEDVLDKCKNKHDLKDWEDTLDRRVYYSVSKIEEKPYLKDNTVWISLIDIYNNINKIYSSIFENKDSKFNQRILEKLN